jgi:hypothetical protein
LGEYEHSFKNSDSKDTHNTLSYLSSLANYSINVTYSFTCDYSPGWTFRLPFRGFLITHTIRHTVRLLWTSDQPVAETSTYTGKHNIETQQTSVPRERFEPATPATRRPQTYALDRVAIGIGINVTYTD